MHSIVYMRLQMIRTIDLFAGIGGLRLGFEQTGKTVNVLSCELNPKAAATYQANFKDNPLGDVTKLKIKDIPEHDILLAGFPCQPFSFAGKRKGFKDTRGTLFFNIAKIIDAKKPKAILLENVKGLLAHDHGRTFKTIKESLESIGYCVHYEILNAKDFGIPQNRERIYIVGIRSDLVGSDTFKFPTCNKRSKLKDVLERNVDAKYFASETYYAWMQRHRARHESKNNGFGYIILDQSGISNAIVCGGMGRERNMIIDNTKPKNLAARKAKMNDINLRKLTPRECARLQGFPDNFVLPHHDTQSYKQLGNAVAVPVINAIANKLIQKVG